MGQRVNFFFQKIPKNSPFPPPPRPKKKTFSLWRYKDNLESRRNFGKRVPGDFVEKIIAAFFDFFSSSNINLYQGGERRKGGEGEGGRVGLTQSTLTLNQTWEDE